MFVGGVEINCVVNGGWFVDCVDDDYFLLCDLIGNGAGVVSGFVMGFVYLLICLVGGVMNLVVFVLIVIMLVVYGFIIGDIVVISDV